jgi:hypothetical protein
MSLVFGEPLATSNARAGCSNPFSFADANAINEFCGFPSKVGWSQEYEAVKTARALARKQLLTVRWRLIYVEALRVIDEVNPVLKRGSKRPIIGVGHQSAMTNLQTEIDFPNAKLHGANLKDANMVGSNLQGADLSEADLTASDLSFADLTGADLHSARLVGANLSTTEMTLANLEGADMRDTDLIGADLYGANLRKVQLRGALLYGADMYDADLSGAKLKGAMYDAATRWPDAIRPVTRGAVLTAENDKRAEHKRRR